MTSKFKIDGEAIRQLAEILVDTALTEIEYEDNGHRIRVSRSGNIQTAIMPAAVHHAVVEPAAVPHPSHPSSDHPGTVKSPMVGTAYLSSEPGAAPFVKVGDTVGVGQTLLIIEAMKVMNPIKAPSAGKILQVLVSDSNPVEYGEPLMIIE
jgi:acetyl-CoA carboxylase biotin carboxyl carrier protein